MGDWFLVSNAGEIPSPALLLFPERFEQNLQAMIALVGGEVSRLWPHLKTHKLPQVVRRQVELGITRGKCATIAEAEMAAAAGATELLVAQQPVGPNVPRLLALQRAFPQAAFSTLVDDLQAATALSAAAVHEGTTVEVLLDLDVGQHRTGVPPEEAGALYAGLATLPGLRLGGLHGYDGHLTQTNVEERAAACAAAFAGVENLRAALESSGCTVPRVIAGGTPTFPLHAANARVECSPGTCVLWDAGYATKVPDLPFIYAAVLLTRVVSRPGARRLCLDFGHKAVASEMAPPRAVFPQLPDAVHVTHSEEHLVVETASAEAFPVGSELYAIPWHICPTVALHAEAWVVRGGRAEERWPIVARARTLTI